MRVISPAEHFAETSKIAAAILVILFCQTPGTAVTRGLDLASGSKDTPIQILADHGIEWQKDNEILIASGNAQASRDGVKVVAEELRAYYRKKPGGGADLYRLDATGGVKIFSDTESITGQTAVFDFKQAILKVDGKFVVYKTENDTITATQQMEYWERQQMAVARGNAVVVHDGTTVRANILKVLLRNNKNGKSEVYVVEAFENVLIVSNNDRARADSSIYRVDSGIVILTGNVSITRGKNILKGDRAEVNLNTGISKLLTVNNLKSGQRKKKRIRGLIYPQKQ